MDELLLFTSCFQELSQMVPPRYFSGDRVEWISDANCLNPKYLLLYFILYLYRILISISTQFQSKIRIMLYLLFSCILFTRLRILTCLLSSVQLLWPLELQPTRLPTSPWDFPSKFTGVGCYFLLQVIFLMPPSDNYAIKYSAIASL